MKTNLTYLIIFWLLLSNINGLSQTQNLDNEFGTGGIVDFKIFSYSEVERPMAMRIQPDNKIIVAGWMFYNSTQDNQLSRMWIIRLNPDGSLDNTFSDDGIDTSQFLPNNFVYWKMLLQDDGKILTYGFAYENVSSGFVFLARLNNDGTLDNTFGQGGILQLEMPECYYYAIKQISNGKILAAGQIAGWDQENVKYKWDWLVTQFNDDGSFDEDFAQSGSLIYEFPHNNQCLYDIQIDNSNNILTGGRIVIDYQTNSASVLRCSQVGDIDNSFGDEGIFSFSRENEINEMISMDIQSDGKIVATGCNGEDASFFSSLSSLLLLRINSDGTLDPTFGADGYVIYKPFINGAQGKIVGLQPDGKIVVAGITRLYQDLGQTGYAYMVLRYNSNGTLDNNFGNNGMILTNNGDNLCEIVSMELLDDGKILLAGEVDSKLKLVKYLPVQATSMPLVKNKPIDFTISPNPVKLILF